MALLDETFQPSYAGVEFQVDRSTIKGGPKVVVKEFVNSDVQSVETLGKRPREFRLTAVVSSDRNNENYLQRRDNFLRVLENGKAQILVHPLYGRIENVKVSTFTLTEEFTELGEAKFQIDFVIDNSDGLPVISGDTLSTINNDAVNAIQQVNEYLIENFSISNIFPSNFTAAIEKANDIVDAFEENTTFLKISADSIDDFTAQLVNLQSNIVTFINTPAQLINSIDRLFDTVSGMYSTAESSFEVIDKFSTFGSEDEETPIVQDTQSKVERAFNQNILNNLMKSQSLLLNYQNASAIDFQTVEDVERVSETLEELYQDIATNADFDRKTLSSISTVRNTVQDFFEQQKIDASKIVTVNTKTLPARVIAYQYYGDSSSGLDIAELNEDMNVSFLNGNIEVFAE